MKKKEIRVFTPVEYDREAAYLCQMHQSGWKLVSVTFSPFLIGKRYCFEAVEPEEVTYVVILKRLDTGKTSGARLRAGWEEVCGTYRDRYFRKATRLLEPGEGSRMKPDFQRVKQLMVSQFLPYGLIFVSVLLPKWQRGDLFRAWWSSALFMLLNALYLYLLVRSSYYMRKIAKEGQE